jgi:hypothetical protein
MTLSFERFMGSLDGDHPPSDATTPIEALWWDAKGQWDKAHGCVNSAEDPDGMRVHAYLHRKEGDLNNADYWYRRAGHSVPSVALDQERQALLGDLLKTR